MKVRYRETREGKHKTNHFKLNVKCGLDLGLFNGLVNALVNQDLNLGVEAVGNVVFDEILESGHRRIGLDRVADDLQDDFHG
jgi:hypothetical protein